MRGRPLWYQLNEDHSVTALPEGEFPTGDRYTSPVSKDTIRVGKFDLTVSTVFLGLDHSYTNSYIDDDHRPILFETMIFQDGPRQRRDDRYQRRYRTWDEAKANHDRIVEKLKATNADTIQAMVVACRLSGTEFDFHSMLDGDSYAEESQS